MKKKPKIIIKIKCKKIYKWKYLIKETIEINNCMKFNIYKWQKKTHKKFIWKKKFNFDRNHILNSIVKERKIKRVKSKVY